MASANVSSSSHRISDIENEPCKMLSPIEGYEEFPLMPLDISVESLGQIVPNVTRNAWIAKERTEEESANNLSRDESAAIHLYTMEWRPEDQSLYLRLNTALRAQNRDLLIPYFAYLKLVLSALWKLPSVKKTVWRGVKADLSAQYPVGKTFVLWGFSSCTESLTTLESEKFLGTSGVRNLFNIECESGKEIHRHSYFQNEKEILLLPATQFQVLGKINPASGFYIIHLKETTPPFPLLQPPFSHSTTSKQSTDTKSSPQFGNKTPSENIPGDTIPKFSPTGYRNSKLEMLIQKKSNLPFAEFREKQLNDEDAHLIAIELAKNTSWETLGLAENNIGVPGAKSLADALRLNSTLNVLRLENNRLGDDGIARIAFALSTNKSLTGLVIRDNQISGIGAVELAKMLQDNRYLKTIDLQENSIGDSGMTALAASLKEKNTTLKDLHLGTNQISHQSVVVIVDLLLNTSTLESLQLRQNQFSDNTKLQIRGAAKKSRTCLYLR